jgi:hypothetical protein
MNDTENQFYPEVFEEEQLLEDVEISDPVFITSTSEIWCTCCKEGGNE